MAVGQQVVDEVIDEIHAIVPTRSTA